MAQILIKMKTYRCINKTLWSYSALQEISTTITYRFKIQPLFDSIFIGQFLIWQMLTYFYVGDIDMLTVADMGELGGVKNHGKSADVLYGRSLIPM